MRQKIKKQHKLFTRQTRRVIKQMKQWSNRALKKVDIYIERFFLQIFQRLDRVKYLKKVTAPLYRKVVRVHHRAAALVLVTIMLLSIGAPVLAQILKDQRYELNGFAHTLLGPANENLSKKITYDKNEQMFQFNKDAKKDPATEGNPLAKLQSQIGGEGKEDTQQYSVDIPEDLSKGITYFDNQMELSFKLIPQFKTMIGQERDGHLVFPLSGHKGQVVYTATAAGLKENVVLYESPGSVFETNYKIELPQSLEARLISETGELGIYSADPMLFGNISYGSSDDQAKVEDARNNSKKTFLTFKIPAPIVMGLNGADQSTIAPVKSGFSLNNGVLKVTTTGLDKAEYPLAIDPSVTVDSTSDFQTGNLEDNNGEIASGSLKRGALTGGSTGSYVNAANLSAELTSHSSVVYNGYLYVLGGADSGGSVRSDVRYAAINADGTLGSWNTATSFSARANHTSVVYNGYLYVLGGYDNGYVPRSDVQYAPINANGTLGTWSTTTGFSGIRAEHASVVYGGYVYVMGGYDDSSGFTLYSDVQYAPINANGTLGTWSTTTVPSSARYSSPAAVYNGYLYIFGGISNSNIHNDVQYAPINADGTLGTWSTTTSFGTARSSHTAVAYGGYIYVSGGEGLNDVQYAPINADGTLGTWSTTTSFGTARAEHTSLFYNGFVYLIGGADASFNPLATIQYTRVNAPGVTTSYTAGSSFSVARSNFASVAHNGFLYVIGGHKGVSNTTCLSTGTSTYCNDVQYAPINADTGGVGTWASTTAFPTARAYHAATVYNGYLYITGGFNDTRLSDVRYALLCTGLNSGVQGCGATAGTVGTWFTGASFSTARNSHTTVAYGGYLYVVGGSKGASGTACLSTGTSAYCNDVQYSQIGASGSIGGWNGTSAFTTPREAHTMQVYGGYMYLLGGSINDATYYNDVQYAPINANGTLGAWTTNANSFFFARSYHSSVVSNGYLYILGGWNGSTYYNDVQYAPINANGTLGAWNSTTSMTGATRRALTSVVYNGYIYALGGVNGSTRYNNSQYARINNGGPGAVSAWANGTTFSNARYAHATVAYNGYLYVMGGVNASTRLADVQKAAINRDGTLGAWVSGGANLPTARSHVAAVAHNGFMYILGGNDGSYINQVQRSVINPADGTLGAWTPDSSFAGPRVTAAAVYNGYLYIVGGHDQGILTSDFFYTGSQQTFTVPAGITSVKVSAQGADGGNTLNDSYIGGSGASAEAQLSVTPGETLYIQVGGSGASSGGYNGGGAGDTLNSGSPTAGGGATDVRKGGTGIGNRVVVAGGGGGAGGAGISGYSMYASNGGGGGSATISDPGDDSGSGVCTGGRGGTNTAGGLGGTVPAIGDTEQPGLAGSLGSGGAGGDATGGGGGGGYYGGGGGGGWRQYAGCGAGGGSSYFGAGTTSTVVYQGGTGSGSMQDGYASISYGRAAYNDVQYAQINSNGSLGSWNAATSMATDRTNHTVAAYNGYLYVLGGDNKASSYYASVLYASINSDGTIGSWSTTASMTAARSGHSTVLANGYIYSFGGFSLSGGFLRSAEYAPINSNGTLGNWQSTRNMSSARSNESNAATAYNGRVYITGGRSAASTYLNATEYAGLWSIPRKVSYSKLVDLGTVSNVTNISYTGVLPGGKSSIRYRTANTSGVFGAYKATSSFSCSEADSGRYIQIAVSLDDGKFGTFRDDLGSRATLDSITIDSVPFAAPPEKRLRHGAFFQNDILQPFNTNNIQCGS